MKHNSSLLPFFILAVVAVLGCSRFIPQATNSAPALGSDAGPSSFSLAGKEWKKYDIGDTDINVELPGPPTDKTPPDSAMPAGTKQIFSAMRINSYDEKDFQSSYSELVPTGKRPFTIKELADTSMGALRKQAHDLKYTLDVKSPTNAKYNGSFTRNGKAYEVRGCCLYKKDNPARIWAVITVYATDNADGKTASERIIQSAAFEGSTETCN